MRWGFSSQRRMGGAKRYPSTASRGDAPDGFRYRSNHPMHGGYPRRVVYSIPAFALAAGLSICALTSVAAQVYPSRPIRLVVGFAAGGSTDFMARLLADKLGEPLRQPVFVENRTGANGALGAEYVAKSEPDGYTLYFTTAGVAAVYPHPARQPALRSHQGLRRSRPGGVQFHHAGGECRDAGQFRRGPGRAGTAAPRP